MSDAVVGDDILGEDPTVRELEDLGAEMLGKEAGLFVTSGTLGNQVAVMTFAQRGEEIIVGDQTHIYNLEVGALAALSQVQARPVAVRDGRYDPDEVERAIRPVGIQSTRTALVCLENTYNLNEGLVLDLENVSEIRKMADSYGIPIFLDGARIFNAATALGLPGAEVAGPADAVMFCLSKGLSAPVGSLLVGTGEFIDRARVIRQRLGGGMRQAGVIAAAGIVALRKMVARLAEDHALARRLALGLSQIRGLDVDPGRVQTNIVGGRLVPGGRLVSDVPADHGAPDAEVFLSRLLSHGVKAKRTGPTSFRMVTHHGITEEDIDYVIDVCRGVLNA